MRKTLLATVAAFALGVSVHTALSASTETYRQLNLFGDVFERIRSDYVEEVKDPELIEAAINGMLRSLDPHSSYLNQKNYRDMQVQTRGEFGGLGIEVTMENGLVKVVSPIDDTPAARAGLKAGDFITHLDGEQVLGLSLQEAVEKMRGPVNSSIKLTVARPGADAPFDVDLKRDVIRIQSVRSRLEGDIGYVRITTFNEQTEVNLERSVKKMRDDLGPKLKGLILDLRNNPGGLLDQAVAVSDAFLDQGEIVSTRGRRNDDSQRYNAKKGDLVEGKPLIVMINGGSASASEIVAGALQDHRRAIVLGTKSFGKGSVQTIIPLQGHGAIRLTTARYYTPSGRSIQATGIEPDIEVEQAKVESLDKPGASIFRPRSEADLRGHLLGPDEIKQKEEPKIPATPPTEDKDSDKSSQKAAPPAAQPQPGSEQDFQLAYALDLMRGLTLLSNRANN
jgi:carboxyl-terminal processing protease